MVTATATGMCMAARLILVAVPWVADQNKHSLKPTLTVSRKGWFTHVVKLVCEYVSKTSSKVKYTDMYMIVYAGTSRSTDFLAYWQSPGVFLR